MTSKRDYRLGKIVVREALFRPSKMTPEKKNWTGMELAILLADGPPLLEEARGIVEKIPVR